MLALPSALLAVLTPLTLAPQGGPPSSRPTAGPATRVTVETWDDKQAKTALNAFKKATKGKKVPLGQRLQAVEALGKGSHEKLVKPLTKVLETDKALTVRKAAAAALAVQPQKPAKAAIVRLLTRSRTRQGPEVTAALIRALAKAGYTSRDWKHIDDLFEKDFGEKYSQVQKAILELVIEHEEKQAWRLLTNHIDEPAAANVHDAANPPAEYWERRWKAWRVWRGDVKEAMFALTGQRFSSAKEARAWAKENGRKAGIR